MLSVIMPSVVHAEYQVLVVSTVLLSVSIFCLITLSAIVLNVIMPRVKFLISVIRLNVVLLSVIMLSDIMLIMIMLSVKFLLLC
jgi:hypothetical protein